ncbi:hypothetical protein F4X73_03750 [Candidatus Poribacteria bacterium]|nr:hypothetical protein [Candidatus Poribacteria bacterium]MYF55662.1 hypothetical protein [Candidatus Poribacteria bacterium]
MNVSDRSTVSASQSIVTAIENLIDVVGVNENNIFPQLTEQDYQELVRILDDLIDVVGEDENHLLAAVMDFISILIENYENENVPELIDDFVSDSII